MKVTRAGMQKWIKQLEETISAKEETLGNAESADSPNDDRINLLNEEIQALEEIQEAVQAYFDLKE